jgi:hypothetical protein
MFKVNVSGPVFDGRADAAAEGFATDLADQVARHGVGIVRDELDQVLQHPTGFYRSNIVSGQTGPAEFVVNDSAVIYGPWLAGVGSRNFPVTRFRGYRHWPLATARLDADVDQVVPRVLPWFLARMGGTG